MGKKTTATRRRGRPPKGHYRDKAATLTTRITPKLRTALDREAKLAHRSLSQEVEWRLRNTFDPELRRDRRDQLAEVFGGHETFALLLLLGQVIQSVEFMTTRKWHDDAYTREQVQQATAEVLTALGPRGEAEPPKSMTFPHEQTPPSYAAAWGVLTQVRMASEETPIPEQNDAGGFAFYGEMMKRSAGIRRGLGTIVKRLEEEG